MRRIGLVVVLAVSLALVPLAVDAQQPGQIYRIGFISGTAADAVPLPKLRAGLRELGYVQEGARAVPRGDRMRRPLAPPALVTALARVTGRPRGVEMRKMFGYPAVFVNGNMIAGLIGDRMVIRLAADDRERFLALPGAAPFIAMKGRVMRQWAVVSPARLRSPARLGRWLVSVRTHGRSMPRARAAAPTAGEMTDCTTRALCSGPFRMREDPS